MGVYLAKSAGLPVRSVASAVAAVGQGLLEDRYQTGRGEWCYHQRLFDDVTLIAVEALTLPARNTACSLPRARHDGTWR